MAEYAGLQKGRDPPIQAQAHGRDCISDGIDVIGLKGPHSRHMVGLVQRPARLILMPQCLVRPPGPHFHAHLRIRNIKYVTKRCQVAQPY